MRDFKKRLKIIWALLMNNYTSSSRQNRWWLWTTPTWTIKFEVDDEDRK